MLQALTSKSKCIIIAPSNTVEEKDLEELYRGEEYLKGLGLEICHSKNLKENSYELKARDVEEAFKSDANIILAAKGGDNLDLILPYIDYSCITEKIICGFSDITSLLNKINYESNIITFHGCNAKTFGRIQEERMDEKTFEDFKNKFFEKDFSYNIEIKKISGKSDFSGKIVGGNLGCFVKFLKQNKDYNISNCIVILEELGFEANKEDIENNLRELSNVKGFENISGIIVGNYESMEEEKYKLEDIIVNNFERYNFNIVKGDFFGHGKLNLIIPIGSKGKIKDNKFSIIEKIFK